ncbi:MAG: amidase [Cyanophyceae cyanobacterium]
MVATTSLDLAYLTAVEAGQLFRKGSLSPVELTEFYLKRIDDLNPSLKAYITPTPELALEQAKAAEAAIQQGDPRPLLGIPIAHKDIILTDGIRTTGGSAVYKDWIPDFTATAIEKLADAGMVMLGKLSTNEFAFGLSTDDHPFPPARNPWNLERIPGGSSSGSGTALAAGLTIGALGTDTGGSIRNPGALSGIAALKATYGRCSRYGVLSLSWSMDHIGPMARTCEDAALMLQAMAGYDPKDPASATVPVGDYITDLKAGVKGLKLGVIKSMYEATATPESVAAFDQAVKVLSELGAEVSVVEIKSLAQLETSRIAIHAEAYAYHAHTLQHSPQLYPADLRHRFLMGGLYSAQEYIDAQRARLTIRNEVDALFEDFDGLLSPTYGATAPTFADAHRMTFGFRPGYTQLFNTTGQPAITVPCGFGADGLPLSLQIAGRAFDEAMVLRIAHAYEQATPWHLERPSL